MGSDEKPCNSLNELQNRMRKWRREDKAEFSKRLDGIESKLAQDTADASRTNRIEIKEINNNLATEIAELKKVILGLQKRIEVLELNQQIAIFHSGSTQAGTYDQQLIPINVEKQIAKVTRTSLDKIMTKKNIIIRGLETCNLPPVRVASKFFLTGQLPGENIHADNS